MGPVNEEIRVIYKDSKASRDFFFRNYYEKDNKKIYIKVRS